MKKQIIATIAAVLMVGCGKTAPGISIHEAATQGNLNRIKDLIAAGEDVNKKYEGKLYRREFIVEVKERLQGYSGNYLYKGYSPLHLAAMNGHEPVIKYLIANGADLNATSSGGTPLHLAIEWEGAIMDLARGTDVYWHKLRNNKTAKLLISEGADLNMTQGGGETILYKSITESSADFLEYLVANGADVNMKNAKGFTPLHRAVASRSPSPEKIELLISHGAKVNARTKAGTTPLDWVIENKKISGLLRKHGGKRSEELKTQESE